MLDKKLFSAYLRQQRQLAMPDFVLSEKIITLEQNKSAKINRSVVKPAEKAPSVTNAKAPGSASRLKSLRPVAQLIPQKPTTSKKTAVAFEPDPALLLMPKREALKEMLFKGCNKCHLCGTRKKYVFGSGNAEASIMVIGEAPGAEEDEQGLPFVGEAGAMLTKMLNAIGLNRKDDVFISNVLKCRPPENRNPETSEILACMPVLLTQISIIKPKAILLLGRIAAHAVLGSADSIAKLRSKVHDYNGIPSMVVYHPAALLRSAEYKKPAWEDLQKFQALLESLGIHGTAEK
ncbi:MAG: uracil-DNA glycosylase [Fibrobacter sp.]|nr:uracil-DNA glycosylase [Fibrobacter sp.]